MYASLDVAFSSLNSADLFDRIVAGVEDEQDIRTLCSLMISKLITLNPDETRSRLNSLSHIFRKILSTKLKDNAVKQEIERAQEASLGVIKITRELQKAFPAAESLNEYLTWKSYVEWMGKEYASLLRTIDN